MSERFCKDCRWSYHWHVSGTTVAWLCRHASAASRSTDLVTGETRTHARPCDLQRRGGECGLEGKHWEAKDEAPSTGGFIV
jgi:hypothetical protein